MPQKISGTLYSPEVEKITSRINIQAAIANAQLTLSCSFIIGFILYSINFSESSELSGSFNKLRILLMMLFITGEGIF
jgi:hypothetical protein